MIAYLVIQDQWYGGIVIEAVFSTRQKAEGYIASKHDRIARIIDEYVIDVDIVEIGWISAKGVNNTTVAVKDTMENNGFNS